MQKTIAPRPSFTVTTQPHPSWNGRKPVTTRNFKTRADAEAYAEFFGRSTIVEREITPCADCGGHGSDGPVAIHWSNPNNMAMRCGRCEGTGEEPWIDEDEEDDDYPDIDPYRD